MLTRALQRILNFYEERPQIHVSDTSKLSRDATIRGAKLIGDIEISEGAKIMKGVKVSGRVKIGRFTSINGPNTDILSILNPIDIGNFASVARNVTIQEYNHRFDRLSTYYMNQNIFNGDVRDDVASKGKIVIGHDVWIGTHSVVLSGCTIGNGAIVAANSVVTSDIPPFSIAAGSPARVIKQRFEDGIVKELQRIQWWHWPIGKIKANKELFLGPIDKERLIMIG